MPTFGPFVYTVISEENKIAKFGDGSAVDGNGFVEKTEIEGKVVIPEYMNDYRITVIGRYAFRFCDKITEITLPKSLIHLDDASVTALRSIKRLIIPSSVVSIGIRMDYFCELRYFAFEKESESIGTHFLQHCEKLEHFVFPPRVETIGIHLLDNSLQKKSFSYCGIYNFENVMNSFTNVNSISSIIV